MLDLFFANERFARRVRPAPGGYGTGGGGGGGAAAAGGGAAAGSGGAGGSGAGGAGGGSGPGGNIYNQAAWLLQPSSFLDIDKYGVVALPAIGATAMIVWDGTPPKIPSGRHAKITGIGIEFQPNGATGTGLYLQDVFPYQLEFRLTTDAVGTSFGDFALFHYMPGSVSDPMAIAGLMVKESQTLSVSVKNISVVVAVPSQFIGVHLQGYSYPKNLEPKNMGYQ